MPVRTHKVLASHSLLTAGIPGPVCYEHLRLRTGSTVLYVWSTSGQRRTRESRAGPAGRMRTGIKNLPTLSCAAQPVYYLENGAHFFVQQLVLTDGVLPSRAT